MLTTMPGRPREKVPSSHSHLRRALLLLQFAALLLLLLSCWAATTTSSIPSESAGLVCSVSVEIYLTQREPVSSLSYILLSPISSLSPLCTLQDTISHYITVHPSKPRKQHAYL
jgi:hypothetical protein